MLVEIEVLEVNKAETVSRYDALGCTFKSSADSLQPGWVKLSFSSAVPKPDAVSNFLGENIHTYLEFPDGVVSPLYIRQDRNFDD